jgi:succinate dehydrogenase/fumarate reductase flavoprotein subunit
LTHFFSEKKRSRTIILQPGDGMALVDDSERALFLMPRTTSLAFVLPICVIFTVWFQQLFFDNLFVTHILVDEPRQPLLNSKGLRGSRRTVAPLPENLDPVLIVGSGLAGLTTALHVLDRGGNVVVIEKEHVLGGNSNKAASGINACCPHNHTNGDYLESFENDTIKAAGDAAQLPLIKILVNNSGEAVSWLKERVGVDLSLLAQLGGHSHKRTHRPKNGMVGVEIMYRMQKAVRAYETSDRVRILVDSRVTRLLVDDSGRVTGAEYQLSGKEWLEKMKASNVVLATGGFAADRSSESYLAKYRPELLPMAATTGSFSTGDGIALATAIGAGTIEMNKVQVHPTGWVDPQDPTNTSKILAAEVLRGVGGILIDSKGER